MSSEAPSPKRRRTDQKIDDVPTVNALSSERDLVAIKRHPEFWFDDGSIVLLAGDGVEAFRVHRTMLAERSEIFRDMLLVGDPGAGTQEMIEGCPVVRLPDNVADVVRLMKALYRPLSLTRGSKMTLSERLCYLRIASKYMLASSIREELLSYLRVLYPTTRSEFCNRLSDLPVETNDDIIHAVYVGVKYDVPEILPAALYRCCLLPPSVILQGTEAKDGSQVQLDPATIITCLAGRSKLLQLKHDLIDCELCSLPDGDAINSYGEECERCHTQLLNLFKSTHWYYGNSPASLGNDGYYAGDLEEENPLCSSCTRRWRDIEKEGRDKIWKKLPECFGLAKSWSKLLDKGRVQET